MKKILFINKLEKYEEKKNYIHLDYLKEKINDYDLQDLKKIINFKYDLWLREAKDFHEDISLYFSDINKNWWLTDSSRFIMWKTKFNYNLNNYFYAKAIIEIAKKHDEIVVVGKNDVIKEYINFSLTNTNDVLTKDIKKIYVSFNKFKYFFVLKLSIQALFGAIKYWFISLKNSEAKFLKENTILVSTMALNKNIIKEKKDHFFGKMLSSSKYVWVYNDYPNDLNETKKNINLIKKNFFFILEFGSLRIITKSLFSYWKLQYDLIVNKNLFVRKNIKNNFWALFFNEFFYRKILHENIFYEIYLSNLYSEILNNSNLNKIILPYEENGWQRSVLREAKKKEIMTFGYAHASHSQGHKYYFSISKKINPIRPNKILLTGKNALLKFKDLNYEEQNLIILGSDKYHKKNNLSNFEKKEKKNILFMCGVGLEIVNLAKILYHDEKFFKKFNLIIRENPHSWAQEHLLAKKILKEKNIEYQISTKDFQQEILSSKYIIYETSTAGLEGILMGRLGIQINITDNIYSNQFQDIKETKIRYCMSMNELKNLIYHYETLDENDYYELSESQIKQAEQLIEKKNKKAIELIEN